MKQVPTQYLIIGNGRMATHCAEYFSQLHIPFLKWNRQENLNSLQEKTSQCSHILLLIRDDQISGFYRQHHRLFQDQVVIHFSGALQVDGLIDLHPLMTFAQETYDQETYLSMGFVTSYQDFNKKNHFPQVPNEIYSIEAKNKPLYHAHCVMAGNFTHLLWTQLQSQFEKWNLPHELYAPYLKQTLNNLYQDSAANTFTGPLARKDRKTLTKNLQSLDGNPYQEVYQVFVKAHLGRDFLEDQEI